MYELMWNWCVWQCVLWDVGDWCEYLWDVSTRELFLVSLEVLTSHCRSNLPLCIQALRNLHCDSIDIQVQVPKLCNLSWQHQMPYLRPSHIFVSTGFEENREPCVFSMKPCQRADGSTICLFCHVEVSSILVSIGFAFHIFLFHWEGTIENSFPSDTV